MKIVTNLHLITLENKFFHAGIYCKINQHDAFFLVDTGASRSVLDIEKITQFGLTTLNVLENEKVLGIGSTPLEISIAVANSFTIENYELKNVAFVMLDLSHINDQLTTAGLQPIDGILGNDFLVLTKSIIDYRKLKLEMSITRQISRVFSNLHRIL